MEWRLLADPLLRLAAYRATGATIMGRRMYSGGQGPWEDDPNADGWWGDEPPFHHPVFVLTHHAREPHRPTAHPRRGRVVSAGVALGRVAAARGCRGRRDVAVGRGARSYRPRLAERPGGA